MSACSFSPTSISSRKKFAAVAFPCGTPTYSAGPTSTGKAACPILPNDLDSKPLQPGHRPQPPFSPPLPVAGFGSLSLPPGALPHEGIIVSGGFGFCSFLRAGARIYPGHFPNFPALALAPLFLLFWERFLRTGTPEISSMSLVYACLVLAGHAQFQFYFSIFCVFYALWSVGALPGGGPEKEKGKRLLAFALSVLLGVVISSLHLLPALDFVQNSFRQRMTYEFCSLFSFAPENFLTFLYPSLFGDRVHSPYWGRNNLWEMTAYIGVIPFILGCPGCLVFPSFPENAFPSRGGSLLPPGPGRSYPPLFPFVPLCSPVR